MVSSQQPHNNRREDVTQNRQRYYGICRRVSDRGNAVVFSADERELFKDIMANEYSLREQVRDN